VLLRRFGRPAGGVGEKSSATDLVSDADRDAERVVIDMLRSERPEDGVLAEEGSRADADSGRRWLVDPLDGTTNYLYGYPMWSVSVALEDAGGGLAAVVHDPVRGETFRAARGGGCELNGERIRVSRQDRLDTALIATGFGYAAELRAAQAEGLRRLLPRVRDIRRAGSAALDLAWVACGRLDGYFERGLNPWDWAGGRLLVTEAGGETRALAGEPAGIVAGGQALCSAIARLVGDERRPQR
jgi:myo-inositol-1(or 4)-monophosphatase